MQVQTVGRVAPRRETAFLLNKEIHAGTSSDAYITALIKAFPDAKKDQFEIGLDRKSIIFLNSRRLSKAEKHRMEAAIKATHKKLKKCPANCARH